MTRRTSATHPLRIDTVDVPTGGCIGMTDASSRTAGQGLAADEAIALVRRARPGAVEPRAQEQHVRDCGAAW